VGRLHLSLSTCPPGGVERWSPLMAVAAFRE